MDLIRDGSLLILLAALSFAGTGCGKSACFHWTELEGACPAADEAIVFFQNPNCINSVQSVDSEGEFDGELCCYDVTSLDTGDEICSGGGPASVGGMFGGGPAPAKPVPPPDMGAGGAFGGGGTPTEPAPQPDPPPDR